MLAPKGICDMRTGVGCESKSGEDLPPLPLLSYQ